MKQRLPNLERDSYYNFNKNFRLAQTSTEIKIAKHPQDRAGNTIISAGVSIITSDDYVLYMEQKGHLEGAGGLIVNGENISEGAVRELLEEFGIDVYETDCKLYNVTPWVEANERSWTRLNKDTLSKPYLSHYVLQLNCTADQLYEFITQRAITEGHGKAFPKFKLLPISELDNHEDKFDSRRKSNFFIPQKWCERAVNNVEEGITCVLDNSKKRGKISGLDQSPYRLPSAYKVEKNTSQLQTYNTGIQNTFSPNRIYIKDGRYVRRKGSALPLDCLRNKDKRRDRQALGARVCMFIPFLFIVGALALCFIRKGSICYQEDRRDAWKRSLIICILLGLLSLVGYVSATLVLFPKLGILGTVCSQVPQLTFLQDLPTVVAFSVLVGVVWAMSSFFAVGVTLWDRENQNRTINFINDRIVVKNQSVCKTKYNSTQNANIHTWQLQHKGSGEINIIQTSNKNGKVIKTENNDDNQLSMSSN